MRILVQMGDRVLLDATLWERIEQGEPSDVHDLSVGHDIGGEWRPLPTVDC